MKSQWMVRNIFRSVFLTVFAISIFALFGCSVTVKTVPVEERIPLVSDSIQKGEQMLKDFKITYAYRLYQKNPISVDYSKSKAMHVGGIQFLI